MISNTRDDCDDLLVEIELAVEPLPLSEREAVVRGYADRHLDCRAAILAHFRLTDRLRFAEAPPVVTPQFRAGERVGPFRIVRFIARGGMGEVYEAVDETLDRPVALKILPATDAPPTAAERFRREAVVLAEVHHSNVVPIHHAGEQDGVRYCAMQFVRGASLHHVVGQLRATGFGPPATGTSSIRRAVASILDSAPPGEARDATRRRANIGATALVPRPAPRAEFFASVAGVFVQAAEALHHVHRHGYRHRDVKPSNLMVDAGGTCWVIDFGLAGFAASGEAVGDATVGSGLTRGPLGTPEYMAPEQFDGRAEPRSDVWGLGATLYQLLTLQPPFDGSTWADLEKQVRTVVPIRPRRVVPAIPRDLEAICLKAMAKKPEDRYPTAQAMADDLRRWLGWQPTAARPGWWTFRPLRLWAWRRKAVAALAFVVMAAPLVVAWLDAGHRHREEQARDDHRTRERRFEAGIKEVHALGQEVSFVGRPKQVRDRLRESHDELPEVDLRDDAADTLVGVDAEFHPTFALPEHKHEKLVGFGAVAFGPRGQLLVGGCEFRQPERVDRSPARLFRADRPDDPTVATLSGAGPVAFADADTPLQLVPPSGDRKSAVLWNVATNTAVLELTLPDTFAEAESLTAGLSPDGRFAAASATRSPNDSGDRTGTTILWRLDPKAPVAVATQVLKWERAATAVAFSPDSQFVAIGTREGEIRLHRTSDGGDLFSLTGDQCPVKSLAFGNNRRRDATDVPRPAGGIPGWLLAAGYASANVTVWNLETQSAFRPLVGTDHYTNALAFTSDGSQVVTVGDHAPTLWDVATGRPLFRMTDHRGGRSLGHAAGVGISPDDGTVAVTTTNQFSGGDERAKLYRLRLDRDRGVSTYHGLSSRIERVWLSASGRWVAALSQGWEVGVWERVTGKLAFVWTVPVGSTTDNADLTFEHGEGSLLFASGEKVVRLDVTTGERTGRWVLPSGLNDQLHTPDGGMPFLLRRERVRATDGGPAAGWEFRRRELQPDGTWRSLDSIPVPAELGQIHRVRLCGMGRYFVVESEPSQNVIRSSVFDSASGRQISITADATFPKLQVTTVTDHGRAVVTASDVNDNPITLVSPFPAMTDRVAHPGIHLGDLDATGRFGIVDQGTGGSAGLSVFRVGEPVRLITFDHGQRPSGQPRYFSRDGRLCFWGRADGTVCVADIDRCVKAVAEFAPR